MDGLRWSLLALGIVVIVGVWLYGRRKQSGGLAETDQARREPTFDPAISEVDEETATDIDPAYFSVDDSNSGRQPADEPHVPEMPEGDEEAAEDTTEPVEQKIVTLRIIARGGSTFRGDELVLNLRGIGMRHGKFGIFHRYDGNDEDTPVFSAASLVEPGSFDLANIKEQEIPGISLFAVLPGPVDGVEAFDMLMAAARTLAQSLDGELLDESGSTLSIQRERYMREEVVQYQHNHKVA
jgi:cell division protein ZipA